jgi:serine transporter
MQQNSIAADSADDHAPLADASRWHPQDTVWTLGLFGTAIGAGVLFLPINAGIGGLLPLLIATAIAFPITYFSHRALARFVEISSSPDQGVIGVVGEQFGDTARRVIAFVYFATIYSILLLYSIAVTNTALSFIENQLHVAAPSRAIVSIVLILGLLAIVRLGQETTMKVMSLLVYPFILSLLVIGLYLMPRWNFAIFSAESMQSFSLSTTTLMTLWMTLPVLVMSFNHFPIISPFVVFQRRTYGAAASDAKCARIQRRAVLLMVAVVFFFVYSSVLTVSPAELQEAKAQNITILSYLANRLGTPVMAYLATFIAFVGIIKSFLGHYVGAYDVMSDVLHKYAAARGMNVSSRRIDTLIVAFVILSCWLAAYLNINVLTIVETFAGPAGAIILLLVPMYAIRTVPALARYRGRPSNAFVTVIGVFTVSAMLYGLLG